MITAVRANKKDMASRSFSSFVHQTPLQLSLFLCFVQLPLSRLRPITSSPTGLFGGHVLTHTPKEARSCSLPPGLFERGGGHILAPAEQAEKKNYTLLHEDESRARLCGRGLGKARQTIGGAAEARASNVV
ncbi:uncharacterized protein TrAtP1_008251 [Trichoderma atroviride]|uniref:uncharacterized protein n=1 Tax=Hypocrea atroviridis TaxID=63577 RepID=UPI0033179853|nr:hypothetical protein TrAtP1_008251 [Trichoderma atroviride]